MTKFVRFVPLLVIPLIAIVPMSSCSRVEPGHVGIKVSNFGSSAGVSDHALGVGWYFTPFFNDTATTEIYTLSFNFF